MTWSCETFDGDPRHALWSDRPAEMWIDGYPIGNGTQGVMIVSGRETDRLSINDARAWSGSPSSASRQPLIDRCAARESLAEARRHISEGRAAESTPFLQRLQHRHSQSFLPFADLSLRYAPSESGRLGGVHRVLDLAEATYTAQTPFEGGMLTRRVWASRRHQVVVVQVEAARPVSLTASVTSLLRVLDRREARGFGRGSMALLVQFPSDVPPAHDAPPEDVEYADDPDAAGRGALVVTWRHDGADLSADGVMRVERLTRGTIVISTAAVFGAQADATTAEQIAGRAIATAWHSGIEIVRAAQLETHRDLYDRAEITLGSADSLCVEPTHERLRHVTAAGLAADPALAALLFHYGRYLLIASTGPGSPPPNLQGIWNDQLQPPWSSNYTINVNLQMNFWPAEVTQLGELAAPLFDLIESLVETGSSTATELYDLPGWVAHHNTDRWGYTPPVGGGTHDPMWAFWPFGGVWLARHLQDHLEFGAVTASSPDEFARERMWQTIRAASAFALGWLRHDGNGYFTSPSTSPENQFRDEGGAVASAGRSSTLDISLTRDLLMTLDEIASRLGIADDDLVERAREVWPRLPHPPVGRDGGIAEWADDPPQVDAKHRHQSHLWFVYPGGRPYPRELDDAARRSLDARGDDSTGWSLAWRLALRARLREPERISRLLRSLFRDVRGAETPMLGGLYGNMLAVHPPFQIDANFGYVAALAEMLLQSHRGEIELLPALPAELAEGRARGLVARPGVIVDIRWQHGALIEARLRSRRPAEQVTVRYGDTTVDMTLGRRERVLTASSFLTGRSG